MSNTKKILLKCVVIDGSLSNGVRQPILYSFVIDKLPSYKIFSEPETIHYKTINKSVVNAVTFYLEDHDNEEVNSNGETLTFTLQMIKIYYFKRVLVNLKQIVTVLEEETNLLQQKYKVI